MTTIKLDTSFFTDKLRAQTESNLGKAHASLKNLIDKKCVGSEWTGWFDYPKLKGFAVEHEVRHHLSQMHFDYDTVVVIGIGGSYLGTRAVADALTNEFVLAGGPDAGMLKPIVYAGHHLSGPGMQELLQFLKRRNPVINVISKSGTTTEPSIAFRILRQFMEERYGAKEAAQRIIATTDPKKGALRELATQLGYKTFEVPDDLGGRYSVLSAVGVLPLSLAGIDCRSMLRGADQVFAEVRGGDASSKQHPIVQYAAARAAAYTVGEKHLELMSYSDPKLRCFIEWWKQLYGESEGKQGKGLFPASLAYTTDLHSLGQFVQEGRRNLFETFLCFDDTNLKQGPDVQKIPADKNNADDIGYLAGRSVEEINTAATQATMLAHFDGGVPCLQIQLPALNAQTLGAAFAFFETACAVSAAMIDVNPFDQPGVEAYKKNLFGLLGKPGFETIGAKVKERLKHS